MDILRFTLEYAGEKKLTRSASSLTFTTVLAIVPLLAVVLALFTAFPLFAEFRGALEAFLSESLLPPAVSDTIMRYLNQFAAQASGLTAVGGAFLLVTSILLIMTIDEAFNEIWRVERQRPLRQRLLVYWAIISLGPILTGASLWATTVLARESLGYIGELPEWLSLLLNIVPLAASALGFTALFVFVPNCRVLWRDALMGGVGTAVVLAVMKAGFTAYLTRFPSYTVIYGAFATLPIFLLWIYLSWLVVLMGAMVASLSPALRHRRWAVLRRPGAPLVDAIHILHILWRARGSSPPGRSLNFLEQRLGAHPDALHQTLRALRDLGYVVPAQDADLWVLACDPAQAGLGPLLDHLLIDRAQAGLSPWIAAALAETLAQRPPTLESLFRDLLPENGTMVQNTEK
ncbi:YihY family inner membrane protein [Castellaniella sp. GW247-6E4]|uniref:YihY family inner membrane protein n=1 Tax=Castellaniella sp. GW247-6E4 TaxID=3140380 RepID=UPI0033159657